jgi:hypothetical protein
MKNLKQVANIIRRSDPNTMTRFAVVLDQDAAEIMGETKFQYLFATETAAKKFAAVLQSNLDALHDEALAD